MDITTIFNSQSHISSVEAYNIWNTLQARYLSAEKNQLFRNFVHDNSLKKVMDSDLKVYERQIQILEKQLQKYKIKSPHQPPQETKFSTKIDAITDKMIFRFIINDIQSEIYDLKRSVLSTTTSEELREIFISFTDEHLKVYKKFYVYGKTKGWTEIGPAFKTKPVKKEPVSVSEANHVWDHLNLRYDQLQVNDLFLDFVHDTDFLLILQTGKKILNKQIKILEDLAVKFEIPLPERPPAVMEAPIDPEIMEDQFAFRLLLGSMLSAVDLHTRAVMETIRNDNLRDIFHDFLMKEYNLIDKLFRYGKIKGWMHIIPSYRIKA